MRKELTDGTIIIQADTCDCGLTGGCEKCNPIIATAYRIWNYNKWNKITGLVRNRIEPMTPQELKKLYYEQFNKTWGLRDNPIDDEVWNEKH